MARKEISNAVFVPSFGDRILSMGGQIVSGDALNDSLQPGGVEKSLLEAKDKFPHGSPPATAAPFSLYGLSKPQPEKHLSGRDPGVQWVRTLEDSSLNPTVVSNKSPPSTFMCNEEPQEFVESKADDQVDCYRRHVVSAPCPNIKLQCKHPSTYRSRSWPCSPQSTNKITKFTFQGIRKESQKPVAGSEHLLITAPPLKQPVGKVFFV